MEEFTKNTLNLINVCSVNNKLHNRIDKLYKNIRNEFILLDDMVELRIDHKVADILPHADVKQYIFMLLKHISEKEETIDFLDILNEDNAEIINNIVVLIYNYAINKISLENIINDIYLSLFDIDSSSFLPMNYDTLLDLCELKFRNVDIYSFSDFGPVGINLVKYVVRGELTDKDLINVYFYISSVIDKVFSDGDDYMLDLNTRSYLVALEDDNIINFYNFPATDSLVAAVDRLNGFIMGSLALLVQGVDIKVTQVKRDYLQELINSLNQTSN